MEIDRLFWRDSVCGAAMNDLACPAEMRIVARILHEGVRTFSDCSLNVKSVSAKSGVCTSAALIWFCRLSLTFVLSDIAELLSQ